MNKKICAALLAAMLVSSAALAAESDDLPSEVNADVIEYDVDTGIVAAEGNVLLKHGLTKATGLHAMYNVNTKAAHLIGNVIVVREDMRVTCNTLASNGQGYMVAEGNVIATQNLAPNAKYPNGDTRTFTSEHIDFFPDDRKHFIIPNGGFAQSQVEGTFTADQMEGWLDDERYVGRGNAHLVNLPRNLEAGGDQVDYDGKNEGKAVLSGNAWAIQDNNTIRGNRLTVYLADDGSLKVDDATKPKLEMPPAPEFNNPFTAENSAADKSVDDKSAQVEEISFTPDKTSAGKNSTADNSADKSADESSADKSAEKNSDEASSNES